MPILPAKKYSKGKIHRKCQRRIPFLESSVFHRLFLYSPFFRHTAAAPKDAHLIRMNRILRILRADQISIITGRIIGLRLVFLNRNWLRSFLIVDLIVAQSEMLRLLQTSRECMAIIFIASIKSSLSFI